MTLDAAGAAVASALLFLGLALATVGLYGLLRKRDIFEQLHASGLVSGPGVLLVLLAAVGLGNAEILTSAVLVIAFVLVTASLSTHAIALAAWRGRTAAEARSATEGARQRAAAAAAGATGEATRRALRAVVAFDGSPDAAVAARLAAALRWPAGSHIRLIAAIEGDLPHLSTPDPTAPGQGRGTSELEAALDAAVTVIERPGLTADRVVRRGQPGDVVSDEAAELGAHLVIVGTRGQGRIRELIGGSVASEVLDTAPCPVLVARTPEVRAVLLPTDGSAFSARATALVAAWGIFDGLPVHVLSVAPGRTGAGPGAVGAVRARLEGTRAGMVADRAAARLRRARRTVFVQVRRGEPVAQIAAAAAAPSIDLVVIGSRGRTGLRRALLGSVARAVVSSADASVLVVREAPDRVHRPA